MGLTRNGARTVLNLLAKACRLSRLPGFRGGVREILGTGNANSFFTLWDPFCAFIDLLIAGDDWYNQIDYHPEGPTEDREDTPTPI